LDLALSAKLEMRVATLLVTENTPALQVRFFSILYISHQKDWLNVSIAAGVLFQRENE
jgi:hypothetical protein